MNMEVINKSVPGQENYINGSVYWRNRTVQSKPLRAHDPNVFRKDLQNSKKQGLSQHLGHHLVGQQSSKGQHYTGQHQTGQQQQGVFKHPQKTTAFQQQRNYNSLPRMLNSNSASVSVQANTRYVSKVFVEM